MAASRRSLACIGLFMAMMACGSGSVPSASVKVSPSPRSLAGAGVTWQVVAIADGNVYGLALDGHQHIYAVEYEKDRVVEFSLSGRMVARWGERGSGPGQMLQPIGVALDKAGNVYVSDNGNDRIQKFSSAGEPLAQWGNLGDGPAQFNFPVGVTLDGQGNIYVADAKNFRVQKLSPAGAGLAQWGGPGDDPGQFHGVPADVAVDDHGDIFVAEAFGLNRIHEFSAAGAFLARWGGTGDARGSFIEPRGILFDGANELYIADTGNNRIQKVTTTGTYIAQWGGPSAMPLIDQSGIALDASGRLYLSVGNLILETCVASSGCS